METLQRLQNRGSVSTGYEIANSLKFEADNSEYLKWTNISTYATSARKKTFSFSVWFKISELGVQRTIWGTAANGYLLLQADGELKWQQSYGSVVKVLQTNRVLRDTSAWYNVIVAVDTTQATEANRQRIYINGVEETSFSTSTYPSQNDEADNVYESHHSLGAYNSSSIFWCGYMANVAFISDAQITPSDVGEFDEDSGIWKPKAYSGGSAPSYFLEFKDSSDLGTATGLDADTLNNIAAADQSTDTPTNNFCTMNPLWAASYITYTEGATNVDTTGSGWMSMVSTFAVSKGKWYWEFKRDSGNAFVGIVDTEDDDIPRSTDGYFFGYNDDSSTNSIGLYSANGQVYNSPGGTPDAAGFTTSNIVGVAVDMDNYKLYYHIDGTYAGSMDPANGTGGVTIPTTWTSDSIYMGFSGFNGSYAVNFGGYTTISISSAANDGQYGTFEYAPPSGYYALCTKRLAEYG